MTSPSTKAPAKAAAQASPPKSEAPKEKTLPAAEHEWDALELLSNLADANGEMDGMRSTDQPVLLCNSCGGELVRGRCSQCGAGISKQKPATPRNSPSAKKAPASARKAVPKPDPQPARKAEPKKRKAVDPNEAEFWDLVDGD